ncbi:hypothetical protein AB0K05_25005 [Nonomuraea sp. NPDC049486]|uniref:hypothetical protein n=1 Tax=Nonomuraea sp. NPDC049486 TaxID=3155773 RepID=UPI00343B150D
MDVVTMGRKTIVEGEVHESSLEKVAAREVSKAVVYLPPWIVGPLLYGLGWVLHVTLRSDDAQVIAWTMVLMTVCVIALAVVTWFQSHARSVWGRVHTTATTVLAGMWMVAATINSPAATWPGRLALIGGLTVIFSFNIRAVLRRKGVDGDQLVADPLKALFGAGAERAGITAQATTTKQGEHKAEASVQLEHGKGTAEDLQKKVPYIESGAGLPPGSITVSLDPDDASKAKVTISDPRVLKNRIPWPGPSRPGGSIAEPMRLALWQDLDPLEYVCTGHHLQVNGMTGAGKSIGGAWNFLAEAMTRFDVAIFAADTAKKEQTLGPLRRGLHRFETEIGAVRALLRTLHAEAPKRTDWLAARGYQKWVPGCGLTYWIIWLEEFPKIFDALPEKEQEKFLELVKELRSAGGTIVMSLQRSDYSQMPTLARSQLAKWCFGLERATDGKFALSEAQRDGGARPELWANKVPGMSYLDAPSIPDERIAMANRTFDWGADDQEANARMRQHADAWPAAAKEVDEFTAIIAANFGTAAAGVADGQDDDDGQEEEPVAGKVKTENPSPELKAGIDDPIEPGDNAKFPARPGPKMEPGEARGVLLAQLAEWAKEGREEFAVRDLKEVKERTGRPSRGWLNDQLALLADDGVIERDDERRCYRIVRPDVLAGETVGV